jgi:hypothetical protein
MRKPPGSRPCDSMPWRWCLLGHAVRRGFHVVCQPNCQSRIAVWGRTHRPVIVGTRMLTLDFQGPVAMGCCRAAMLGVYLGSLRNSSCVLV